MKTAVVICGRFNPFTIGHEWLISTALKFSKNNNYDFFLLPTKTENDKNNPIPFKEKIKYIKSLYKETVNIVLDENIKHLFNLVDYLKEQGYDTFIGFGDNERRTYYESIGQEMTYYSLGIRKSNRKDLLGISGTKARNFAKENNFEEFEKCIPKKLKKEYIIEMFNYIKDKN